MKKSGYSVTVACDASSIKEWFDPTLPLRIIRLQPKVANEFRKRHVKGFIKPGSNNLYIGVLIDFLLFGVLGFSNPTYGNYDILMKADTTPTEFERSTDLLLFCLRTKEVKKILEDKFNRRIETIYSMCFSANDSIGRYRKHAELHTKIKIDGGYNLGYIFKAGSIISLKEAKAQFIQKSWKK